MCFPTFSNISSSSFIKRKNLKVFHPPQVSNSYSRKINPPFSSFLLRALYLFSVHIHRTETSNVQMPLKRVTAVITRLVWSQCKHKKLFCYTCLVYRVVSKKKDVLKVGRRCTTDTVRNKMPTVKLVMLSSHIFDINIWIQTQHIFFYLPRPCKWWNQAAQRHKVIPHQPLTGTHPQRHWVCIYKSMHLLSTDK